MSELETRSGRCHFHPLFSVMFFPFAWVGNIVFQDRSMAIQALMTFNVFVAVILLWRVLHWLKLALIDIFLCLAH